ncbi:ATP synthase subunit s, mitochondrial isoform X2 [Panulirus ornatus]|uniref:ATP synthase subunit s, mitochondrial isoform X2 n=1 Tax=Panulirus ornatus TaxID=150431 RepID=UPI003A8B7EE4
MVLIALNEEQVVLVMYHQIGVRSVMARYIRYCQPFTAPWPKKAGFYNKVALAGITRAFQSLAIHREHHVSLVRSDGCLRSSCSVIWSQTSQRTLWGWLNAVFNKVDENRIKEVGPDRACAEWLLRCGAFVKWQNRGSWTKDYNSLPATGGRLLKIEEVDATDSAIMHIGFPHFRGCKCIRRIVFHKASYLDDAGLIQLPLLEKSLKELQISSCGNVTADGLRNIKKLVNLEYLLLYDLPEISNKDSMVQELQEALPRCAIVFPYAQAKDDPNLKEKEKK